MENKLSEIFYFKRLILELVKRDIRQKYIGSFLGIYWAIINPFIFLIIYCIVFGIFLKMPLPGSTSVWDYFLWFAAGFFPWMAFSEAVVRGASSIVGNSNYIKKVPFPSEIFPITIVLAEIVNLCISITIFTFLYILLKGLPTIAIIQLPIAMIFQFLFTLSLSFLLSSLSVHLRDISHMLGSILQICFWATPIIYNITVIPNGFEWIYLYNPIYYLINIYREILFYNHFLDWVEYAPFIIFTLASTIISYMIFRRLKTGFADYL